MRHLHLRDSGRSRTLTDGNLTLRTATPEDADRLAQLAALDSVRTPLDPILLAEVAGEVRAALSLSDGMVIADPFYSTAGLVELLHERASELSGRRPAQHGFRGHAA